MKIGMRTIKTAIGATLAIIIANALSLLYPTAAGIITLLSVTNTKRSSFKVALARLAAWLLALVFSYSCFWLVGFNPVGFGLFLLFFIPTAAASGLSEGIPVNAVLVTHYLAEGRLDGALIVNSFLLLTIGVGIALIANLYMPDRARQLVAIQAEIDTELRLVLTKLANNLAEVPQQDTCTSELQQLTDKVQAAKRLASQYDADFLFSTKLYYQEYFAMRFLQIESLKQMDHLIGQLHLEAIPSEGMLALLRYTAETFAEENDGRLIQQKIQTVLADYRQAPLPASRDEFEARASLYQLIQEFEHFIGIKVKFATQTKQ